MGTGSQDEASRTRTAASGGTRVPGWQGRWWAASGVVAGIGGVVGTFTSIGPGSDDPAVYRDAARIIEASAGREADVAVALAAFVVAAFAVVVFGAGLRRHLAAGGRGGSAPDLALAGTLLVAELCLVGTAPATDVAANLSTDTVNADVLAASATSLSTTTWVWGGLALTSAAVALGALGRDRLIPRWLGVLSAVFAAALAALAALPLQYLAAWVGALWLMVTGVALLVQRPPHAAD